MKDITTGDLILDISTYNKITDYSKVKNECDGVILRIGYAGYSNGKIIKDKGFANHLINLQDRLPIGVYFLDQSINENEAIIQANWTVLEMINNGLKLSPFPIWIDSEASADLSRRGRGDLISNKQRTDNILAFCTRCNQLGFNAGIYASDSWLKDKLEYDRIKHLPIWNAKYNSNNGKIGDKPVRRADMHQFTSRYQTSFCKNGVDMSIVLNDSIFRKFEPAADSVIDNGFYPIPNFTLDEHLAKIGLTPGFATRKKIAIANGQNQYTGALNQNLKMLELLQEGKLKRF